MIIYLTLTDSWTTSVLYVSTHPTSCKTPHVLRADTQDQNYPLCLDHGVSNPELSRQDSGITAAWLTEPQHSHFGEGFPSFLYAFLLISIASCIFYGLLAIHRFHSSCWRQSSLNIIINLKDHVESWSQVAYPTVMLSPQLKCSREQHTCCFWEQKWCCASNQHLSGLSDVITDINRIFQGHCFYLTEHKHWPGVYLKNLRHLLFHLYSSSWLWSKSACLKKYKNVFVSLRIYKEAKKHYKHQLYRKHDGTSTKASFRQAHVPAEKFPCHLRAREKHNTVRNHLGRLE